jgi:maleate isomerase
MYYGWRGIVGMVKPTFRPGSMEDFVRLMPDGVGVLPLRVGAREGTEREFLNAHQIVEQRVSELAELGVDVIVISGTPLTMLYGEEGDRRITKELEEKYGVPIITSTRTFLDAFKAFNVKSMVITTYLKDEMNQRIAGFFKDCGFDVKAITEYAVPFANAGRIPPQEIYAHAKKTFIDAGGADCILLYGAGWRTLPIIETLENDLGVKVVTNVPAEVWSTLRRLRIHTPVQGYGTLLRELPDV